MSKATLILSLLAVCACTQHPKVNRGNMQPVTFINTKNASKVINAVLDECSSKGLMVEQTGNNSVICSGDASMAAKFLYSTRGGTDVETKMRITTIPVDGKTKVIANAWSETQNIYGQTKRHPATYANEDLQRLLDRLKTKMDGEVRK